MTQSRDLLCLIAILPLFAVLGLSGCAADPGDMQNGSAVVSTPVSDPRLEPFRPLAGVWRAEVDATIFEETWLEPAGMNMTGALRAVRTDGSAGLFELITLTAGPEGVTMRLRHFDAALNPWASEADGPIVAIAAHPRPENGPAQAVDFVVQAPDGREPSPRTIRYDWSVENGLTVTLNFGSGRDRGVIAFKRVTGGR